MKVEKQYRIIKLNFFEMGEPKDIIVLDNFEDFVKLCSDNNIDYFYELDRYYLLNFQGTLYKYKVDGTLENNDVGRFISDLKELFCNLTDIPNEKEISDNEWIEYRVNDFSDKWTEVLELGGKNEIIFKRK